MDKSFHKPQIIEVGDSNFELEVLKAGAPTIVAFCAPWSRPCRVLDTVLREIGTGGAGKLRVAKINADDNPDLSLAYDVQSIPTLLYFAHGSLRGRTVGTASKTAILAKLESVCPELPAAASQSPGVSGVSQSDSRPSARPRYSAKRNLHHVDFFCQATEAKRVCLIGDFNQWQATANPMQRMPDGYWRTGLELPHGYHQYLFLVDGKPVLDPNATGKTRNAQDEPVSLVAVS
jgi:thioredoxin-like negative regulator of GroEL